ncbi:glycine oxidase ThiO [Thiobacter aerophilum]|uniref:Glycine oxidase ThiO n=1 Tax=Thiobacter aerophilum TaxID=3121275 RepID=A0ABV0EH31_9BURK
MTSDFLIIGAGAIGCATALELAAAGARVTLVERGVVGGESSWAGAGLLFPLVPWDYRPEVVALAQAGRRLFAGWAAGLQAESGVDPEYLESGLIILPPYDREAALGWAAREGEALAEVNPRLVEPALDAGGPALWLPGVAQVRNPRLMAALRGALLARGARIVEQAGEVRLRITRGRLEAVEGLNGRRWQADTYIVSAGAWSGRLLEPLGVPVPVYPVRGQMLLFRLAPGQLTRLLIKAGRYVIPRRDGHVLVGSTLEEAGFDKTVTEAARDDLIAWAQSLVPALRGQVPVAQWAGLRPGSPDNVPLIDCHPTVANLWVHTGHFRYGVTMAPASARLLADRLLGRKPLLDPAPYAWPGSGPYADSVSRR